jgi:CP family cyanate transporter-like MFS transporter
MQAYIAFGWFANFFRHHHLAATEAGLLVAFYSGLSIAVSMIIPALAVRGQRPIVALLAVTAAVSYLGMLVAPVGGAWLWMLLGGIGSGMFPLTLTMIGLRSREVASTAALSAFVQSVGYLVAGSGPLLVGLLLGLTGNDWTWPLVLLLVAAALSGSFGWYAGRPRYVEDELAELNTPATQA